jgi:hypothetical protein
MSDESFTKGHLVTLMISSTIGVGFGAGWWFYGTGSAPAVATVLRVLGVVLVLALVGWIVLTGRRGGALPLGEGRGRSPFGRQYGIAVLLMLVAIFAGARLLSAVFAVPEAVPAWVLLVVGLHFVPFAKIFGSSRFLWLGGMLAAVAVLAAVLGAVGVTWAWRAAPGFGGALVLWASVVAGLLDGTKAMNTAKL